jgi:hypothetical protein
LKELKLAMLKKFLGFFIEAKVQKIIIKMSVKNSENNRKFYTRFNFFYPKNFGKRYGNNPV